MASALNDQYELIEKLSVSPGDIARAAYKARETSPSQAGVPAGRIVLLRMLPPEANTPVVSAAAGRAAEMAGHPNVLAQLAYLHLPATPDSDDGQYVVTEFVRGISLRERIRRVAPFSLAVTLDIAVSIAQALNVAAQNGIHHGCLRPEEIVLTPEGQVKVADFELARAIRQARGENIGVYESDVRALGLLVYEMLTGVAAEAEMASMELSPAHLNPNVPAAVDGIVRKATNSNPQLAYGAITRMLVDLRTARDDLRAGKSLAWTPLVAAGRTSEGATSRTGLLSQAADDILREDPRKTVKDQRTDAMVKEVADDNERAAGSPVLGRVIMVLLIFLVIGIVSICTYMATMLGGVSQDVAVPNLIGKTIDQAQQAAKQSHFNLVVQGHDYNASWPAGQIYQESPAAGRFIKSDKDVDVMYSDGPPLTEVPDISQMTQQRATELLQQAGLSVGVVDQEYNDIIPKDIVYNQQPDAHSKVSHQVPINITVSKGPNPPAVPGGVSASATIEGEIDLSWSDVDGAASYNVYRDGRKIVTGLPQTSYSDVNLGPSETHSYTVTSVNTNGESQPSPPATVTTLDQSGMPAPVVAPPVIAPKQPSIAKGSAGEPHQRTFEIRFRVQRGGRQNVQIEVQDTTGTNIVYDEDHDPGDIVDTHVSGFGNKVIIRIFIDGKLSKQETN